MRSQKRRLIATLSLAAFLPAERARSEVCYNDAQLAALAEAVTSLETCRATLALRERFIEEQGIGVPPPELAWWQEPSVVVGGVVVSLSVGLAIGLLVAGSR